MNRSLVRALAAILTVMAALAVPSCSAAGQREAAHNSEDVGFAQMMIPHHEQAVALSAMVPERSTDPAVLELAARIADGQQPEIEVMKALLAQWQVDPAGHAGHTMAGMVDDDTMKRLAGLRGRDFDMLWLESMIAHHRGAIEMAEGELESGENPDLTTLARSIISAQQAEIDQMETMLAGGR